MRVASAARGVDAFAGAERRFVGELVLRVPPRRHTSARGSERLLL